MGANRFSVFYSPSHNILRMCSSMNTRIPVLSRRALMSVLGVSGFAVLLSACGEDANQLERLLRARVLLVRKVLMLPVLLLFPQVRIRRRRRAHRHVIRGTRKLRRGSIAQRIFMVLRRMFRSPRRRRGIRMLP